MQELFGVFTDMTKGLMDKFNKDKGSTFLMVLVCMLMLSILSLSMLSLTAVNSGLQFSADNTAEHPYETEILINEFSAALKRSAYSEAGKSYTYILQNYNLLGKKNRQREFCRYMLENLEKRYREDLIENNTADGNSPVWGYVGGYTEDVLVNAPDSVKMEISDDGGSITLVNMSIYNIGEGYREIISADVIITVKCYVFRDNNSHKQEETAAEVSIEYVSRSKARG